MLRKGAGDALRAASARILQQYSASTPSAEPALACGAAAHALLSRRFAHAANIKAALANAQPRSLASGRLVAEPAPGVEANVFTRTLLRIGGYYSRESRNIRGARGWYDCVTEQVADARLYEVFGLQQKFADSYALLSLHMWLALVRLRSEGAEGKALAQVLYENFQDDVEVRVRAAGVKVRISKHLTDLEQMFYGTSLSYDQALDGKEDLSAALLRNVYGNDEAKRPSAELLARYLTRELACLSMTDSEDVMRGSVSFSRAFLGAE